MSPTCPKLVRIALSSALLLMVLPGCGSDTPTGPMDPEEIDFAEELGVDLAEMTLTGSGLYLLDEVEGNGQVAGVGDRVTVHYTGWLPDGRRFDSSFDRNQPFTVPVVGAGMVIAGWDEGLPGMREGGRRLLVIPPHLAYGDQPILGQRWATLVFRVELLVVEP